MKKKDLELAARTIENIKNNFINSGKIYNTNYVINCLPKYILYYIKKNLPNNLYFQENSKFNKSNCTLVIGYKSKEEKEKLYMEDILNQLRELNHKIGVKKIVDAIFNKINLGDIEIKENDITNNKILQRQKNILIGHNIFLKLIFLISKLGDTLPNEYISFKKMIKDKIDCIYDTKFLFEEFKNSNYNKYNNTIKDINSILDDMYTCLHTSFDQYVKLKIKPNENLFKDGSCKNSGYNSFICGACFLYMKNVMKNTDFLDKNKNQIYLMNGIYKSINHNKEEDDYIIDVNINDEDIFVFKGIMDLHEINFESIFGEKLWNDSVVKIKYCENNNIFVVFTHFTNLISKISNEDKKQFMNIAFNNLNNDKFIVFTLSDFRKKICNKK